MTAQQPVVLWHFSRGHSSKDRLRCQVAWKVQVAAGGRLSKGIDSTMTPSLFLTIDPSPKTPTQCPCHTAELELSHQCGLTLNERMENFQLDITLHFMK